MKVLVTFAVDAEFAPWRELRHFERRGRDTEHYSTTIEDADVTVVLTGIGLEVGDAVWKEEYDICISSGLAGAVKPEHRIAQILAARRVAAANGTMAVACDQPLTQLAAKFGAKIVECFSTVDQVLSSAAEKQELGRTADAVEMESAKILTRAAALGAKVMAIRGISDASGENLPLDFNRAITHSGEVSVKNIMAQVARKPQSIPSLIRFGKQSRFAAQELSKFLDRYLIGIARAGIVSIRGKVAAR